MDGAVGLVHLIIFTTAQLRSAIVMLSFPVELDQYVVTVEIHSHSIVIVDEDVVFNVTCSGNRRTSTQMPLRNEMTLSVREMESGRIVREVIHANQYLLAIASTSNAHDFRVANCTAQNGLNPPIELTDSRGCSLYPSLFTHFKRATNGWYATISSMFRFPLSTNITFSCQVVRCQGECVVHSCIERNSVIRRSGSELITFTESLHTTVLLRHEPEATTTMQAYEQTTQPGNVCEMSGDGTVMCTLCVLLS
ncbi:Zona pellucida domain protein, partial [Trichostrongylus colubriformis]